MNLAAVSSVRLEGWGADMVSTVLLLLGGSEALLKECFRAGAIQGRVTFTFQGCVIMVFTITSVGRMQG